MSIFGFGTKPYGPGAKLPSNVRKLSPRKQRQWRHVWNSVYEETGDESRAYASANSVVKGGGLHRRKKESVAGTAALVADQEMWDEYRESMAKTIVPIFREAYRAGAEVALDLMAVGVKAEVAEYELEDVSSEDISAAAESVAWRMYSDWFDGFEDTSKEALRKAIFDSREKGVEHVIEVAERMFSPDRAKTIAITETSNLLGQAAVNTYRAAGVKEWVWQTVEDGHVDPVCLERQKSGNRYPVEQVFEVAHPRCRCFPRPVLELSDAEKHLQGKHNQKDHGRGRNLTEASEIHAALGAGQRVSTDPAHLGGYMEYALDKPSVNLQNLTVTGAGNGNLFGPHLTETPRSEMPQLPVKTGEYDKFMGELASRGIGTSTERVDVRSLTSTQNELLSDKVAISYKFAQEHPNFNSTNTGATLVSKEGGIIDGHHRWAGNAAFAAVNGPMEINIVRVDLPAQQAIDLANSISSAPRAAGLKEFNATHFVSDSGDVWLTEWWELRKAGLSTEEADRHIAALEVTDDIDDIIGIKHLKGKHDQRTHGGKGHVTPEIQKYIDGADLPAKKIDRWTPKTAHEQKALTKLASKPSTGRREVDGEMVEHSIKTSLPVRHERERITKLAEGQPHQTTHLDPKRLIETQDHVDRDAVAATVKNMAGDPAYQRPGYNPKVAKTKDGLILFDGHHRIEGALLLDMPSVKVDLYDLTDTGSKEWVIGYLEKHLRGKHDQKTHGRGGLAVWSDDGEKVTGGASFKTAGEVRAKAIKAAPPVTKDLVELSTTHGGEMVGLDFAIKGQGSLGRKIAIDYKARDDRGIMLDDVGGKINDSYRYTVKFDEGTYTAGVRNTVNGLRDKGYSVEKSKVYWKEGSDYKGINMVMRDPRTNTNFELQFHTPDSFNTKEHINHPIYERARVLPEGHPDLPKLRAAMIANQDKVKHPAGVDSLKAGL